MGITSESGSKESDHEVIITEVEADGSYTSPGSVDRGPKPEQQTGTASSACESPVPGEKAEPGKTGTGVCSGCSEIGCGKDLPLNGALGDDETEDNPEEQDEDQLPVPDGGYGWLIVLGSFLAHVLIGGVGRSDGLFYLMFKDKFHESATLTAWPGAIVGTLRLGMGPIASAICQRWSVRACCMIAGLLFGLSHIITALNSTFFVLFLSHGLIQGFGRGLLYGPSIIIVNRYFDKRRSLANGLAASGVGAGTLFLVPLTQVLFDTYGFTGGFLIFSGICFNALVMAMMFRPISLHYKFMGIKGSVQKPSPSEMVMLSELDGAGDATSIRSVLLSSSHSIRQDAEADTEAGQGLLQHRLDVPTHKTARLHSHSSQNMAMPTQAFKHSSFWKSTVNILFPVNKSKEKRKNGKEEKTKFFHPELLKDPAFCAFCFSILGFTATFKSTLTFVPALAKSCGLTASQGVLILALSGGVDTAGRILVGYLLDRPSLRNHRLAFCNTLLFLLAGVCCGMPLVGESFVWLCVTVCVFGAMTGILASQKSVICVDLLGAELMPSTFGILLLFQGVGIGVGPLLAGVFRDTFGRFDEAFYLGGGLMGVSACLMLFSTIIHTVNTRKQKEHQNPAC